MGRVAAGAVVPYPVADGSRIAWFVGARGCSPEILLVSLPARRMIIALALASFAILAAACERNDAPRPPVDAAPLYVAIGASDSVGTGSRNPAADGWVSRLHAKMASETRLANLGIGGLQLRQALDQSLPVAVDLQPSVVTLWMGVNDFAAGVVIDDYQTDLNIVLTTLARDTRARVYVANLPDLTLLPAFRERPRDALRADVQRWNEVIAEAVATHGAVLVDLHGGWSELRERPDLISRDGLHPSTRGHQRLADLFWQAMQGA